MMHSPGAGFYLAPLYDRCLFRSDASLDSHTQVAREFCDHGLAWKRGPIDTAMFKTRARRLEIFMLRYGAAVDIHTRPFHDFSLVHLSVKGAAEVVSDGQRLELAQGRVAFLSPKRDLRMSWQEGSEQVILKIPHVFLRERAQSRQTSPHSPPEMPSAALLHEGLASQWQWQMQSLLNATTLSDESDAHAAWVDHFERGIVDFLFAFGGIDNIRMPTQPALAGIAHDALASGSRADARRVEAVERFIAQRLCAPVSMIDLARAANISVRGLHLLFQRKYGMTPMALLRDKRLDAVHERLATTAGVNIADTALSFGFGHVGRFSGYYRERFGELPSETVRSGRSRPSKAGTAART